MDQPGPVLIAIRDVHLGFDRTGSPRLEILQGVSLDVASGSMTVVGGRSGSGKTTLLNVAAGLLQPDRGRVAWNGVEISRLRADARTEHRRGFIGIALQHGGLLPQLTAAENVAIAGLPRGLGSGRARAAELLDQVDLGGRRDHFPDQLSGGERQRVALARALFADPPVVIVDEPTANLDRRSADDLIAILTDLAARGRALLVASHDQNVLARAQTTLVLD